MEVKRISYKNDIFGNPIYCNVSWKGIASEDSRPIALVYHAGGFMVGSADIIPQSQIEFLTSRGFVVVAPNYRLAPQATARESIRDAEDAHDWSISTLPPLLKSQHNLTLDPTRIVTMGHSVGGTLALHLAATRPVRATTALYPSLYVSEPTSSARHPTSAPPFGLLPDFGPSPEDWASIAPADRQVSEAGFAVPGTVPPPRNRWQAHILKHGRFMDTLCPDGDFAVLDPLVRPLDGSKWPATMIVQGDVDVAPGSGVDLARRAEADLRTAGVEVSLVVVEGAPHLFDLPPTVGTTDRGPKWEAVVKGMEWLSSRV